MLYEDFLLQEVAWMYCVSSFTIPDKQVSILSYWFRFTPYVHMTNLDFCAQLKEMIEMLYFFHVLLRVCVTHTEIIK